MSMPRIPGALPDAGGTLVKGIEAGALAPQGSGVGDAECYRRFARARRSDEQSARAAPKAAAEQLIQLLRAAEDDVFRDLARMFCGDEPREHAQAPSAYRVIVIPAAEFYAAHLGDAQTPSLRAVIERQLFQADNAMDDAVQLQIRSVGGHIVERQHGSAPLRQEMFESEDFAAVAERVLGQKPHLRERVDDDPRRIGALDFIKEKPHGFAELDFRWAEHRLPGCGAVDIRRDQFA